MEYSKASVIPFLDEILMGMPPEADSIRIWTDEPFIQFRNKFIMASMKMLSHRHNLKFCWNFSATSHGKGPVDGVGGFLKRMASEKVMSRLPIINNAVEFFHAVQGSKVAATLMRTEHVGDKVITLGLPELFANANAKAIKGISEQHWVGMNDHGGIVTKGYSSA